LQVALSTSATDLEQLMAGIKKILLHKEVISFTVNMNDIAHNAFVIHADYFTNPLIHRDFIAVKDEINLQVLKLMEEMNIEIAGASTGIRLEGNFSGKPV
jgi:MscS family membrane protein